MALHHLASRFPGIPAAVTRFPHLEISEAETELPNVEPDLVSHLDAQEVVELLSQVDEQFQAAVALFYLEDYSYNEIAGILEIPLGTVKSRIARGLAQLKALVLRKADTPGKATGRGCVNSAEAKEVLFLYRPGTADAADPQIAEALELAGRDPELGRWFEQHRAFQQDHARQVPANRGARPPQERAS